MHASLTITKRTARPCEESRSRALDESDPGDPPNCPWRLYWKGP